MLLSTIQVGQLVPSLTGGADDTAAIQAAINSSSPGDTLHFAAGTYLVSQSLVLLPDRNYVGDAGSVLEMSSTATSGTAIAEMVAGSDYEVNLQGLTFNSSDVGGGIQITVNGGNSVPANDLHIVDNTFLNTPGTSGNPAPPADSAIYEPVGMTNSAVEGNIFLNDGGCISLADPNNVSITGNTFTNAANSGIFIPIYNLPFTYGNGVTLSGNTMTNLGGNGIELFGAGGNAPNSLVIDSNTMTNFTGSQASIFGISAVTGTGTQVQFNVIQGGGIGTGIEIGGTSTVVQQNVISGFNTGITIGTTANSTIDDNLIENSASVGITKYNAGTSSGLSVSNNLLVNPQTIGIWMNASDGWAGSIQSNVILRTAGYWANDSGFIGISLINPSGVSTIDDNVVSLNATAAPANFNFEGILNNGYGGNFAGSSIVGNVVVATGPAIGSGLYGNGQAGFDGMTVTGNTLQDVALAGGGGAQIPQTGNIAVNDSGLGYLTGATVISATPPVASAVLQVTASTQPSMYANGSATTSSDGIASYYWLFSDGTAATGTVVTHQYNAGAPSPLTYGYAALLVQDQNGSYATIAGQPTIVVGTKTQTINFTAPASPLAFAANETVALNATGGGSINPLVFSIDPASTATGSIRGNTLTITSAGTFVLDANQAGDFNYAPAAQVQQTLVVSKSNQTINFTAPASPIALAPNETVALSATGGGSGNAVIFSIDPSSTGTGTISGSTLTVTGAGTLVIDANQAGNADFNAAPQVQQSLVVLKGTDIITFPPPPSPVTYAPGETVTLNATGGGSTAPIVFSVDPTSTATGNIRGNVLSVTGAGTFVIDANQAGDASYSAAAQVQQSLVVAKASQTILFTPPTSPIAFSPGETVTFNASGGASGNPVVFGIDPSSTGTGTISGSTLTIATGGTFFIDASQAGNTSYTAAATVQQWLYAGNASAPVVTTGAATQLSKTGATLNATVNPDASTTSVLFQLSTSSTFTPSVQTQVASGFSGPHGLATNAAGDLFVADTFNNQVKEVFPNGTVQMIGSGFSLPAGVAVNAAGDVFVADYGNNAVKEVLPNGTIQTIGSGFNQPFDVAVDSSGDVYVADFGNNQVKEVLPSGTIKTIGSGFSGPSSVAVDSSGDVFLADTYNSQLKEVLPSGTVKVIGSGFSGPAGVAVDASGDVFVADSNNGAVKEVLANGTIKVLDTGLNSPAGIAVDGAGNVFVADTNNARVLDLAVQSVAATPGTLTGSTAMAVAATLTGLTPGTVYYYRPVAANAFGMTAGATVSFTAATNNTAPGTVNITSGNAVYTGAAYIPSATVTGPGGTDMGPAISCTFYAGSNTSGTPLATAPIGAGTYTLLASFGGDSEYTAASATETFQITPKALTIASTSGKTYDGTTADPSPTFTLGGVVGSDTVTASGTAAFASASAGVETLNITGLTLAGAQAGDYTIASNASTTAIITPKTLTIASVNAAGKTYDGTTTETVPTMTLAGIVGSDSVTATGSAVFANSSAGVETVTVTGITLAGAQAGDYTVASNASTTAIITPKTLNIASVSVAGKTYDGTTSETAPTIMLGGAIGTDSVTAAGTAAFSNASAGVETVNITGITLVGAQAGDYTVATNASTTALITPKSLTIASVTAAGKTYDGTTVESAPGITLAGVIGTDTVTATGTAAFANASAGVETVNIAGITLGGPQAADYSVASSASASAMITPKALVVMSVTGKVYDGTTSDLSPTIVLGGVIGSDNVMASGSVTFSNASAGVESVNVAGLTLNGAQAADYTIASNASTSAIITQATPLVTVTDAGGQFTGSAFPATATVTGVTGVAGSTLEGLSPTLLYYSGSTATGTASTTAPSAVGTYTVVGSFAGSGDYAAANSSPVVFNIRSGSGIFTITPTITLGVPTQLKPVAAVLNATVNPNSVPTNVLFQYSTSPAFTPAVESVLGSGFSGPHGVAVNAAGDLFVADTFNNEVKEVFPSGTIQIIGSGFSLPAGVAVDSSGDVFVADYGHNAVKEVLPDGTIQTIGSGFNQPFDVAVDSAGDVFVADFGNNAVKEILPNGTIKVIGSGFSGPSSVAVDSSGDVFVADTFDGQIKEVLPGATLKVIGSGFDGPEGVAVDASGDVYVADGLNNAVKEVLPGGTIQTLASGLNDPGGVAVDGGGNVFISDTSNARVLELSPPTALATPYSLTGSSPVAVSATLTGLTPGTVYYYRAVACSPGGTAIATGQFTTPAAPDAGLATNPAITPAIAPAGAGSSGPSPDAAMLDDLFAPTTVVSSDQRIHSARRLWHPSFQK